MKDGKITMVIADDHRLVLEGLVRLLADWPAIAAIHSASNGFEAYALSMKPEVDVLISDIEMPEMSGIELLRKVKQDRPELKVLMLSMHNNSGLIREVIQLQADGYMLKSADREELQSAITAILSGNRYFDQKVVLELARQPETAGEQHPSLKELTKREKEILKLIAQGYSNKSIADKLFISIKTVDSHRTHLMQKLDIHNTAGLTRFTIQAGLI